MASLSCPTLVALVAAPRLAVDSARARQAWSVTIIRTGEVCSARVVLPD